MATWIDGDASLYRAPKRPLGAAAMFAPLANAGVPAGSFASGEYIARRGQAFGGQAFGGQAGGGQADIAKAGGARRYASTGTTGGPKIGCIGGTVRSPASGPSREKTARDLQREIRCRSKRRSDVHKPVLALLRRRIEAKAALNHVRMVYKIPEFLPGLPVYDVSEVARSIADALDDDGFLTELYEPDTLYVSWDKSEGA